MNLRSLAPQARLLAVLLFTLAFAGCSTAYYSAMEQIGQHKRDILRSRIEAGQEDQQEAQEQIKSTYERFKEAASYDGGDFERVYNDLNDEYEAAQSRADDVSDRIESIEEVAADLFAEWQEEIALYSSASLKQSSERSLRDTKQRYEKLIAAMKRAESKMPPVLHAFRDQVLFMKHSLNARAIAALEGTVGEIESDVANLIRDIDASIREAESFLAQFPES